MAFNICFVFALVSIANGVESYYNYQDSVIECVFKEYKHCYQDIESLGANFSVKFDETPIQLNETCRWQNRTEECIARIGPYCGALHTEGLVERISPMIQQLCKNKTAQQTNFLNSSVCYNRNQNKRLDCVKKHFWGKTDAKSLCCSAMKTQQCIREEMRKFCPRNSTEFQTHVMETFTSYELVICGSILRHCNGASHLMSTLTLAFVMLASIFIQNIHSVNF